MRMQNTLNELDSAIEQWDSITNKPVGEQASPQNPAQERAKNLLKELRQQLEDFEQPVSAEKVDDSENKQD